MSVPLRVLFTCVGGTLVPSALRNLRETSRLPLTLFGGDSGSAGLSDQMLDGFFTVPLGGDAGYADTLLNIAQREKIDIVVPWSDGEAITLSKDRARFDAIGCDVMASPSEVLDTISDKLKTYRKLENAGLSVPNYAAVDSSDDLIAAIQDAGYPQRSVVVKPATGRGGRGLHVLLGQDAPPEWLGAGQREERHDWNRPLDDDAAIELLEGTTLVMPCLKAPVYDADVLARKGRADAVVIRRRTNPTGIPWTGNTICRNAAFEEYARAVTEVLELDSLHDIDLMSNDDGAPALLEVNPRMSGSLAATLVAGIPILDAALAGRVGINLPVPMPEDSVEIAMDNEAIVL